MCVTVFVDGVGRVRLNREYLRVFLRELFRRLKMAQGMGDELVEAV
jgi:hypothetical protein